MRKAIVAVVLSSFLGISLSGCIVHTHKPRHGHHHRAAKGHKRCAPSHYWDGHKCRHKGKGHGARKHDYR